MVAAAPANAPLPSEMKGAQPGWAAGETNPIEMEKVKVG
jgi:hypothetical protein